MGRYTRDELLSHALDLAQSPPLDRHDRPGDVIDQNAYCISWLQSALDRCHVKFPFSADIQDVDITFTSSSTDVVLTSDNTKYLPTDFILDVRDGVVYISNNQRTRLKRKSFQYWLSVYNSTLSSKSSTPSIYTIIQKRIKVAPIVQVNIPGTLWYYKMPTFVSSNTYIDFPDEWTLIEYVHIKCMEWNRSTDLGTAQVFLEKELARLKAAGLLNETEYDVVPIENNQVFVDTSLRDRNSWMGDVVR